MTNLDYIRAWLKRPIKSGPEKDMIVLTGEYYFGGNTVPFTAGQIVDLLRSKYGNRRSKRKDI